ncbi:hypothetical protein K2Z83_25385 [Oscillochloris sp. ZM17-4]|uniref:hypothetical protein n=1 Tax=Oscillochloris sp. ZM17-4 TaxID=2866714 RepID=UPI001C72B388|nr:hypothetical protein [Oscillochloris sp. ZM17-4]MBX0330992.1 hypothetical protein [Oscillochloris sp. ZM17-4]
MAFEILNNSLVTPPRLHAMVRLTSRLKAPDREKLYDLLQPSFALPKLENQEAAKGVFTAARSCGLLAEDAQKVVALQVEPKSVERLADFRQHMQGVLLGITDDSADNYLLNIYSAWYAVQNDRVFQFERKDFETRFNSEIFPDAEGRQFNTTKLNGWRDWAVFLGLGWNLRFGGRDLVVPDAHDRLEPLLDQLLPEGERPAPFGAFMDLLADRCPELDGGVLFDRCWQASRGAEPRGGQLSLMLSSSLRVLHEAGAIELSLVADAATKWQLYPGQPFVQVSHICRRRAA